MVLSSINWIAVLAATAGFFIWGMVYYSPLMFLDKWVSLAKIKMKKNDKMVGSMVGGLITAFVTCLVLEALYKMLGNMSVLNGVLLGFWVWLGFYATTSMGMVLWERKPWALYFLNNGYSLVGLVLAGLILGAF